MSYRVIATCIAMLVFAGGLMAAGCGGGDSPTQPVTAPPEPPAPPPAPTVSQIEVSPASASLEVGKTQQFTATAKASDGAVISGVDFTWSSSNTAVATINSGGVATAVGAGMATIRATGNGITSAPATITVSETPPPAPVVASVALSPSSMTLVVGGTFRFTATALTSDGMAVADVTFTWASDDAGVATVDSTGLVTAVAAGTAMIAASANGITSMPATVTVEEAVPEVASVMIVDAMPVTLEVGDTHQLMAVARTSEGAMIDGVTIAWSSDDNEVATVDSTGLITAVAAGMANIAAMVEEVISEPVSVTIVEPPPVVDRVVVSPASMMMMVGGTFRFMAMALTSDGMTVADVTFTWASDDTGVATVDSTGLVTAVAAGTAMIAASANGITSTPATVTVEEMAPEVASVEIVDAMPVTLESGETLQLTAVARTSDGTMVGGVAFAWSSDDNEVATVDSTGLVTAVGAGMADITAMAEGETSDPVRVTVAESPPVVDRVTVEPTTASIEEGETQRFSATAYDAEDVEITGKTFAWSSSRNSIATVFPLSGPATTATGVDDGSTTITATVDGVSGSAALTVTEPPPPPPDPPDPPPEPTVATVTVRPSSASIEEGDTRQFSATARESDGTLISGKTFSWTSSDPSVATVSPSSGSATTATGVDAGSTTIRATVDGVSGTATLTVTEPPPPPPVVASVTVSPASASIEEGETQRFSATAYTADNTEISGKTFAWSSSRNSIATVSPSSGSATTATGVDDGSTTITATVDGVSGTATLTVTEPPPPMLRSRTGTISGRNNYSSGGSVTLSETSDGKLKLSITGLSTPSGAPDVFVALYTSDDINWPNGGSLPPGAENFGEVSRQSGNKSWTFTPASGENIDSWTHLILHCRLINSEVGSASLSN